MPMITTKDGTQIFYKDWGPKDAQPMVFHHGWPLSSGDWDAQMLFFLANGFRVVAHDRWGHGRSSQVASLLNSPQLRFVCEDVRIRRLMKGRSARFMKFVGDSSRLLSGERILNTAPPGNSE
jgi:pimeloyl-ACP methyl ester carboxylesterase